MCGQFYLTQSPKNNTVGNYFFVDFLVKRIFNYVFGLNSWQLLSRVYLLWSKAVLRARTRAHQEGSGRAHAEKVT